MPIRSTTITVGRIIFFPRVKHSAVMPAVAAVTWPEGKEYPLSAGEPMRSQYCL